MSTPDLETPAPKTSTLKLETEGDRSIVITRHFDAPQKLVFDALTVPDMVKQWMGPHGWTLSVCEIDLRVGGKYRYVMSGPAHAGMDCPPEMGWGGVYREIAAPERLVHTELFDMDWTGGETVITSALAEKNARTTLTLTIVYSAEAARKSVLETQMAQGMELSFSRLDELLARTLKK
jgi:uncharacterized protein YndB with AHSA1/START domain